MRQQWVCGAVEFPYGEAGAHNPLEFLGFGKILQVEHIAPFPDAATRLPRVLTDVPSSVQKPCSILYKRIGLGAAAQ